MCMHIILISLHGWGIMHSSLKGSDNLFVPCDILNVSVKMQATTEKNI